MNSNSYPNSPSDNDAFPVVGLERQTIEASEQVCRESVTTHPDGTFTATRHSAHRALRCTQERALAGVPSVATRPVALPAPPQQLIAAAPCVDIRSALRWSLLSYGITLAALQPFAGWASPGFFAQLFTEPPGLLHAIASGAASMCAHYRCGGVNSFAGRLLPRFWVAFLLLPILPLPLDGPIALTRCALLPLAFLWAFHPWVTTACRRLRQLATLSHYTTRKGLVSSPQNLAPPVWEQTMRPIHKPFEIIRAWFSAPLTILSEPTPEVSVSSTKASETVTSTVPVSINARRSSAFLQAPEAEEVFIPQSSSRARVRR